MNKKKRELIATIETLELITNKDGVLKALHRYKEEIKKP